MRPFPDPSILLHPQMPKPLHLMAPRTILGSAWWDKVRREAYWRHGFRCHACGVAGDKAEHKAGLEAHEMYDIDYVSGEVEFVEVVALCYFCHNYIHRGRLEMILQSGEIDVKLYTNVIKHGDRILSAVGIPPDVNDQLLFLLRKSGKLCKWEDYHMVINGVNYGQRFKSGEEWRGHWQKQQEGKQ